MDKYTCVIGCPSTETLYTFPSKDTEGESRQKWLDFFGIQDCYASCGLVCNRHFSDLQKCGGKLKPDAVPDLHKSSNDCQVPTISSLSYSRCTQTTNGRICATVEISGFLDEYRLNCYYCSNTFQIDKYPEFIEHLHMQHFEDEQAFNGKSYPYDDHDYSKELSGSLLSESKVFNTEKEISNILPLNPTPLQNKPENFELNIQDKPLDIEEATKLIKLLDETLLNPNYVYTEADPLEIENKDGIKPNNIVTTIPIPPAILETTTSFPSNSNVVCLDNNPINSHTNLNSTNIPTPMLVNSFINNTTGETKVVRSTNSPTVSLDDEPTTLNDRQSSQNSKQFETLFLKKPSKEVTSGLFYIKDIERNIVTQETSAKSETNDEISTQKPQELVFQFTSRDIILDFLDNIKDYPILWTFHNEPNNAEYSTTIDKLCKLINEKWHLNLSPVQMRRSVNRILTFYRYMLPCDKVDIFEEYFVKCLEFLPALENAIPHKRCEYCDICYAYDSDLKKHLVQKHKYLKLPYKCEHCWERFKEMSERELHMHLPHYKEIFKCQLCNKTFTRREALTKHLRNHESPPKSHECQVCGKSFKTKGELTCHSKFHGEKKNKCHLCTKSYFRRLDLEIHLKSHINQRDYVCEVCGRTFVEPSQLRAHADIHTDKKVTCKICNIKLRKASLNRHLHLCHVVREGTIESTFRAKAYNYKRFASPSKKSTPSIKRSKKARQYSCKKCNLNFERLKPLMVHNTEVHFMEDKLECLICSRQVNNLQCLKRHYRVGHKLHQIQIFKLIDEKQDLDTVLSIKVDELPQEEIANNVHLFRFTRGKAVDGVEDDDDNKEDDNANNMEDEDSNNMEDDDTDNMEDDDTDNIEDEDADIIDNLYNITEP